MLHAASNPALSSSAGNSEFICLFSSLPLKTNYLQSLYSCQIPKASDKEVMERERETVKERK